VPRRVRALIPILLLCAVACAKGSTESAAPSNEPVRVEVVNRHPLAVEVYAFGTGIERRLGTVEPGMKASFVIPPNLTTSGDVELQVSPAASNQRFRSGGLLLAAGSIVDLIVAPQLFSSTATIRP
jgi:hypothetical protein